LCEAFKIQLTLAKYPYELSGGEQQIFLLIRSLLSRPNLLVVDEPLSAVDFARRRLIQDFLGSWLAGRNCAFLFASHDYEEAVLLAERVLILRQSMTRKCVEIPISLPWPRQFEMRYAEQFRQALDRITGELL
jgi:NitT/TauT family transport system ATP-binding protein